MSDIGLYRTDRTILLSVCVSPERIGQGLYFDGVPQLGAGTVGLHVSEGFRINVTPVVYVTGQIGLRRCTRGGNPVGFSVLIDFTPSNDSVDMVPVSFRQEQRF